MDTPGSSSQATGSRAGRDRGCCSVYPAAFTSTGWCLHPLPMPAIASRWFRLLLLIVVSEATGNNIATSSARHSRVGVSSISVKKSLLPTHKSSGHFFVYKAAIQSESPCNTMAPCMTYWCWVNHCHSSLEQGQIKIPSELIWLEPKWSSIIIGPLSSS